MDYTYPNNVYDMVLNVNWECRNAGIARQLIAANRLYNTNGAVIALAPSSMMQPSSVAATMVLYNLQGKKVGTLANGSQSALQHTSVRGILISAPEEDGGWARPKKIAR